MDDKLTIEKVHEKADGYGELAPAFLEGAKFALEISG